MGLVEQPLVTPSPFMGGEDDGVHPCPDSFFDARDFPTGPRVRHGDLLPLPMPKDDFFRGAVAELRSRRSRQRVAIRRSVQAGMEDTVRALNQLAGFDDERSWPSRILNQAQSAAMTRIRRSHVQRPPPVLQESDHEALMQLLKSKGASGYGDMPEGPGQLASFCREKLSLPRDQNPPVALSAVLPDVECERLKHFESKMMLSSEEMAAVQEKGFHGDCYLDPQLANNPRKYHQFIADLYSAKLINFTVNPRVQVGAFVVTKKGGKQRLIIDARRTNKLFQKPPTTVLGSVDAMSRLEVEDEDTHVFMAQEDVKDYFYRLSIDRQLGEYFCLPMVDGLLLKEYLGYLPDDFMKLSDQYCSPIFPHLTVLPMGFAWAFHLAHEAHCHLARLCLPHVPQLRDRRAAPKLGRGEGSSTSAVMIYADNANHFGVDREVVSKEQAELMHVLHSNNLDTHDIVESCNLAESLGVRIDGIGGKVQPTPHRDWRLHRALRYLSARPVLTGEQLQVVVGHITVRSLLNRSLMGVLRHSYVFIEQSYNSKQRLWKSVAREMDIFRGLMVLGCSDIRAAWDGQPLCTDACLSGYAVMESSHGQEVAALHGRHDERWRFKRQAVGGLGPRARALNSSDVFDDPLTVKPDIDGPLEQVFVEDTIFPEVNHKHLVESDWHLLWNTKIHHKEPVHLIEARSVLAAVKHRARDSTRHGRRILVFNDNMGVVLSIQKGRSCNYGLLRLIRRISAHCLASGLRLSVRWVPSEYNVADTPSRQWEEAKSRNASSLAQKPKHSSQASGSSFQSKCGCSFEQENEEPRQRDVGIKEAERQVAFEDERGGRPPFDESCFEEALGTSEEEEREGKKSTEEICSEVEGERWANGNLGVGERERAPTPGLCKEASRVLRVCGSASSPNRQGRRVGCGFVRLRRSHVLEWRRERCRPETQSGFGVCSPGSHQEIRDPSSQIQTESQGVAETSPHPNQTAYDRICEELYKCYHALYSSTYDGFVQRADIFNICPPWGIDQSFGYRRGEEERPILSRRDSSLPFRESRGLESWDLRRGVDSGRHKNDAIVSLFYLLLDISTSYYTYKI